MTSCRYMRVCECRGWNKVPNHSSRYILKATQTSFAWKGFNTEEFTWLRENNGNLRDASLWDWANRSNREDSKPGTAPHFKAAQIPATSRTKQRHVTRECPPQTTNCYNWGGYFPHPQGKLCLAKGQICRACNKPNHFARYCKTTGKQFETHKGEQPNKHVHHVKSTKPTPHEEDSSTDDEYVYGVRQLHCNINHTTNQKPGSIPRQISWQEDAPKGYRKVWHNRNPHANWLWCQCKHCGQYDI